MKVRETLTSVVLVDDEMRIIPEVLDFTDALKVRGKSINTIRNYLNDLRIFYKWLHIEKKNFYEFRADEMVSFIKFVDSEGIKSPSSINRMLSCLNSFYLHHKAVGGWVTESPITKLDGQKHPESRGFLRHIIDRSINKESIHYFKRKVVKKMDKKRLYYEEVKQFYTGIDSVFGKNQDVCFRNKLIFRVLYETGLRIGELLHLQVMDYDMPDPSKKTGNIYLYYRSEELNPERQLKTGERTIPVRDSLLAAIDKYVIQFRPYVEEVPYIFVSYRDGTPITRDAIEKMFRIVSRKINVKCTPHSLRHTHASELADAGLDPLTIRDRLGHKNLNTSAKYTSLSIESRKRAFERFIINHAGSDLS